MGVDLRITLAAVEVEKVGPQNFADVSSLDHLPNLRPGPDQLVD
jgi:hypothetical protein